VVAQQQLDNQRGGLPKTRSADHCGMEGWRSYDVRITCCDAVIAPGQFMLAATIERFQMPDPPRTFIADLRGQDGGEMAIILSAEPSTSSRGSSPSAPTPKSPAPSASGRSWRRRPCGVTEGKPAGRRGAGG
jgi:hypothetical protein